MAYINFNIHQLYNGVTLRSITLQWTFWSKTKFTILTLDGIMIAANRNLGALISDANASLVNSIPASSSILNIVAM